MEVILNTNQYATVSYVRAVMNEVLEEMGYCCQDNHYICDPVPQTKIIGRHGWLWKKVYTRFTHTTFGYVGIDSESLGNFVITFSFPRTKDDFFEYQSFINTFYDRFQIKVNKTYILSSTTIRILLVDNIVNYSYNDMPLFHFYP